jgi:hypothetical protein
MFCPHRCTSLIIFGPIICPNILECKFIIIAIRKAFSSTLSRFCRPKSLSAIWRLLVGLYMHELAMLPTQCLLGWGHG